MRDGRDCALLDETYKPSSLEEAAALWSKHVENNTNWVRSHNERALEIRYEDLITEPIDSIKLISKFLSKEPRTMNISLENSTYAQVLSNLSSHKLVSGPLKQNNKHKFSRQMNEIEIARFNYFASNQLELWQYPDLLLWRATLAQVYLHDFCKHIECKLLQAYGEEPFTFIY